MKNYSKILILVLFTVFGCKTDHVSERPTDLQEAKIDTTLLYGVWDSEKGGDADFRITKNEFYLVDFFEASDYRIEGNKIEVEGSEFFQNGEILKLSEDSLKIRWLEQNIEVDYWRFKD